MLESSLPTDGLLTHAAPAGRAWYGWLRRGSGPVG